MLKKVICRFFLYYYAVIKTELQMRCKQLVNFIFNYITFPKLHTLVLFVMYVAEMLGEQGSLNMMQYSKCVRFNNYDYA